MLLNIKIETHAFPFSEKAINMFPFSKPSRKTADLLCIYSLIVLLDDRAVFNSFSQNAVQIINFIGNNRFSHPCRIFSISEVIINGFVFELYALG